MIRLTQFVGALVALAVTALSSKAQATLAHSQIFPGWTPFVSGADITLTADPVSPHGGSQSLKFVNLTGTSPNNGGFFQQVPVQPFTLYHFSAWVKGSGVTSSFLNNCFVLDQILFTAQCLPAGTFGWTHMTWNYTTPAEASLALGFYSTNTGTLWFDDISIVQDGTTTNLVTNPGFETSQDSITILSPDETIFWGGGANVSLTSTAATVNWSATDLNGVQVGSGLASVPSGGSATITLPTTTGPGWYGLHLTTPSGAAIESAFTIVANAWVNNSASPNPFGANLHPWTALLPGVNAMSAAGQRSVRMDVRWELVEKTAGVYTFDPAEDTALGYLKGAGVRPLLTMGYSNPLYDGGHVPSTTAGLTAYANYAKAVAQHYGTTVDYDIFNEYNVAGTNDSACGITADCYYALLVPTANAIHTAVPGARVVGPTLGGFTQDWIGSAPDSYNWLKRLLDLGGLAYLDVLAIHNYTWPVVGPPEGNNDAVITAVRSLVAGYTGGSAKPLWLTETGWPTYPGVVTDLQQAQYVVRDAALALRAGISQYMFYDFLDDCADPSNGGCAFGMMRNPDVSAGTLAPKPGVTAYSVLARTLAGYAYASSDNWGSGVYALGFANASAAKRRVVWAPAGNTTLAVQSTAALTLTNWDGAISTITPTSGVATLSVGPDPVFIEGSGITTASIAATPAFTATPPGTVTHGTSVPVAIAVNGAATGAPTGSITFRSAYGSATVTAVAGSTVSGTLTLAAFPKAGVVTVPIEVVKGTTVVGRLVLTMTAL